MTKIPLSVFIIAKNEADRIGTTIASVKDLADEIIVIDSGSTDDTIKVSEAAGARAMFNAWPGYGMQKRFGEDQCKHRWLLNLDADEEVTPALAKEIRKLFDFGEPPLSGYYLKVRDLLPGETKLALRAHTNHCLRLYNREKGRFSDSPVHDSVIIKEGEVGTLTPPVLHRSFRSMEHAIEKMEAYTTVQARELRKKGMLLPWLRLAVEFPANFIKAYFFRAYFLRGKRGFDFAVLYARGRYVRIAKYLGLR